MLTPELQRKHRQERRALAEAKAKEASKNRQRLSKDADEWFVERSVADDRWMED